MSVRRSTSFTDLIDGLADDIARAAEYGVPVTCPDPGTRHGRQLLETLGVEIRPFGATP